MTSTPAEPHDSGAPLDRRLAELTDDLLAMRRQNQSLSERLARLERQPRRRPAWLDRRLAAVVAILVAAAPLVAVAADIFADVPTGAQFHDQIEQIALAGITTGCTATPTYCPDDTVTRKAMAAFMGRGFGRVRQGSLAGTTLPASEQTTWTTSITPGLPSNLLAGATGYIKADATVSVETVDSGCPCVVEGNLFLTGEGGNPGRYLDSTNKAVTIPGSNQPVTLALTGAVPVTTTGSKTIEVRVFKSSSATVVGYGDVTLSYYPFGTVDVTVSSAGSRRPRGGR